jgi:hypothetical protein
MIVVRLMGGLGNQMFQYAVGRAISLKHNAPLKMDVSFLEQATDAHIKRHYDLDIFNLEVTIAKNEELNTFSSVQNNRLKRNLQRFLPIPNHTVVEPTHAFCPEILKSQDNSLLVGFWQTEKYFEQIADVIRKDFAFKPLQNQLDKELAEKISSCNSLSVHIRRGDYVSNPETNKYHGTCSPEYYKEAIELMKTKGNNLHLFIFSDDMQWVKQNMIFNLPVTYIDHNTGKNSYIDMQLMAMCKHNVIANSSFSWWGAWLNTNKDKVVLAPRNWFADKTIDTSDLISSDWKIL